MKIKGNSITIFLVLKPTLLRRWWRYMIRSFTLPFRRAGSRSRLRPLRGNWKGRSSFHNTMSKRDWINVDDLFTFHVDWRYCIHLSTLWHLLVNFFQKRKQIHNVQSTSHILWHFPSSSGRVVRGLWLTSRDVRELSKPMSPGSCTTCRYR